jgi:hypothetical protein
MRAEFSVSAGVGRMPLLKGRLMVLICMHDNVDAEQALRAVGVAKIRRRVGSRVEEKFGGIGGYPVLSEQSEKQRLLQVFEARLSDVESDFAAGKVSFCCEGGRSTRIRHDLDDDSQGEWHRCGDYTAGSSTKTAKLRRILATGPVQDRSGSPTWKDALLFSVEQSCSLAGFNC